MNKIFIFLSLCLAALPGCATSYRGTYWVKGEAGDEPGIRQQQAVAVRNAVLRIADEFGFVVKESASKSTESILTGLLLGVSKDGLKDPYGALRIENALVDLRVSFIYPFKITICDVGNYRESELVMKLKARLEAELANVKPTVSVTFRRDRTQLD